MKEKSKYAPIIVFAFNRVDVLKDCIQSLICNEESIESDLFVFVDGARPSKDNETKQVSEVRDYVKQIKGFKSLHCSFSEINKGLAPSVIFGVTEVINLYGRAIIVEDDLFVSKNFLAFINDGLQRYENCEEVFSICGYTNKVEKPKNYDYDSYFCTRSSSWGWGTWKDRWDCVDWELKNWDDQKKNARKFNQWGGSDCWKMLNDWHEGRNSSWAIRFCYSQFLNNRLSLFPIISKVGNNGFDGRGTHGKNWTRTHFILDRDKKKDFKQPLSFTINNSLYKQAMRYNSLWIRIYSKLMYLIH